MPLYEYKCEKCGDLFEVMQKFADEPFTVHEKCGGKVERLISAPALQFKGSGFYLTDYGKGGSSKGGGENGSAGKSSGASDSGSGSPSSASSSDSKPAAAAPAAKSSDSK